MVKIGSGGANFAGYVNGEWYNDIDYILCRLPYAQGQHFAQNFWALHYRLRCKKPGDRAVPSLVV